VGYISVGQLGLVSIGFKIKFEMVPGYIAHLGKLLILIGSHVPAGTREYWKVPHRLP